MGLMQLTASERATLAWVKNDSNDKSLLVLTEGNGKSLAGDGAELDKAWGEFLDKHELLALGKWGVHSLISAVLARGGRCA